MKQLRIYIDTSVLGGYFDDEFMESTQRFFNLLMEGHFILLVSDMLAEEIAKAPQQVQDLLSDVIKEGIEQLRISDEALDLRDAYINAGAITERYADDAMHVALATLARADVVASWNFKHLVNPFRIRAFNGVNAMQGYGPIVILTPGDLNQILEENDEQEDEEI